MGDGRRGRLISALNRKQAVGLISEAIELGVAQYKASAELGIHKRIYNRWKNYTNDYIDERTICVRSEPANKLSPEERQKILDTMNPEKFASKTPSEVILILADRGIYLGSESTFYKLLKEAEEVMHRGRAKATMSRPISTHKATESNQVWMWNIIYLNGQIKGQ